MSISSLKGPLKEPFLESAAKVRRSNPGDARRLSTKASIPEGPGTSLGES